MILTSNLAPTHLFIDKVSLFACTCLLDPLLRVKATQFMVKFISHLIQSKSNDHSIWIELLLLESKKSQLVNTIISEEILPLILQKNKSIANRVLDTLFMDNEYNMNPDIILSAFLSCDLLTITEERRCQCLDIAKSMICQYLSSQRIKAMRCLDIHMVND